MKQTLALPDPLTLYPLVRNLFRDSSILTFSFLMIVFFLCF
ncbi:MAG: hypothetical protein AAGD09_19785 [Cyanobacteria bacterium P01_F01_bin.56]